ncbi:beta-ketoacyl-ACP synthase 3 [Kitasatospora sp. NPDC006697]|uniref:beta-ketoacyl-ACP synthase 3 n=1 Tax=Kitasatospora sp. NPDC006697 TaxID=3364020 RepID=UPI0036C4673B
MPSLPSPAYAAITALGVHRPKTAVANHQLPRHLDTDDLWIRTRTGIQSRRLASADETIAIMGSSAAGRALVAAGLPPSRIDAVIVATMSHTGQTPSVAVELAARIGCRRIPAFDVSAACAGFSYILELARCLIASHAARHVLLIGAERMTDIVDPRDRTTAVIFADGAGAAIVSRADRPGIFPAEWGSDGTLRDLLAQQPSWARFRDDVEKQPPYLRMSGQSLFRWALASLPPVADAALHRAALRAGELGAFIPHQANARITEALARALALEPYVTIADDIATQGNTSAASIPLAMHALLSARRAEPGAPALLLGFGGGVTFSAQVARLPAAY